MACRAARTGTSEAVTMLSASDMKRVAAHAALEHVRAHTRDRRGLGTTVDAFIDVLSEAPPPLLEGVVPASEASAARLAAAGFAS